MVLCSLAQLEVGLGALLYVAVKSTRAVVHIVGKRWTMYTLISFPNKIQVYSPDPKHPGSHGDSCVEADPPPTPCKLKTQLYRSLQNTKSPTSPTLKPAI